MAILVLAKMVSKRFYLKLGRKIGSVVGKKEREELISTGKSIVSSLCVKCLSTFNLYYHS